MVGIRRSGRAGAVALALALAGVVPGVTGDAVAQEGCASEVEPNDRPEQAPALAGALCLEGTLVDTIDQDLFLWEVAPQDGLATWAFTVRGVPATITSAHVFALPDPVVLPIVDPPEVFRADSDAHLGTPPVTTEVRLPPGRYLLGISRGTEGFDQQLTDDLGYQLRIARTGSPLPAPGDLEPNDDAATATPVSGAFALSGDLSGSPDTFRWTLSSDDAARSWRLEALTSVGAPLTMTLASATSEQLATVDVAPDGSAALHDLRLPPGDHVVTLGPGADRLQPYILRTVEVTDPDIDPEPNDAVAQAVPLDPASLVAHGRLETSTDIDHYGLAVDDALAGRLLDVSLTWSDGSRRMLCINGEAGTTIGCYDGDGSAVLSGVVLAAGRYFIGVSGAAGFDDRYELRVTPGAAAAADHEAEPNDTHDTASGWDPTVIMRGNASNGDVDWFRVHIETDPAVWQAVASGTGISWLSWLRPDLTAMGSAEVAADGSSARLDDLYLGRGDHLVAIQANGDYELTLLEAGTPAAGSEIEPNDDSGHAQALRVGTPRMGRLPTTGDWDLYRFSLRAPGHVILRLEPPADATVDMNLAYGLEPVTLHPQAPGATIVEDLALAPGDYEIQLHASVPSREAYTVRVDWADPFDLAADQEPNDSVNQARPLPSTGPVRGTAKTGGDEDWYELPPLDAPGSLSILTEGEQITLSLTDGGQTYELVRQPDAVTYAADGLPTGVPLYLDVTAWADYTLSLSGSGLHTPPLPVELTLTTEPGTVAAFRRESQHLPATLSIRSTATSPQELTLDGATSQWDWAVRPSVDHVTVPVGETVSVPLSIEVPPDAWAPEPVRVTVRARDPEGGQRTASTEVIVDDDAAPVDPGSIWTVPEPLLGGLDVASLALGAVPGGTLDPEGERALYDGVTPTGGGFAVAYQSLPLDIDVDLAGDAPVAVAGTILHPEGIVYTLSDYPRGFDLLLSEDGADWRVVLSGTLLPIAVDQAFALAAPVDARFARLRIRSKYGVNSYHLSLAEWKVVAAPGAAPPDDPLDIADPALGGHVVWMDPWFADRGITARMLDADRTRETTAQTDGEGVTVVLGFAHDRAASITELGWVDPDGSDPAARLGSVSVELSIDGPLGPWRGAGTWSLDRADDGSVAPFALPEGTWARYVRLRAPIPATAYEVDTLELPASIRVMERGTDDAYRSVVGEWGEDRPDGPYEWLVPSAAPAAGADAGDTSETATPFASDTVVGDQVQFEVDEDWYAITVPAGEETLSLTLGAQPTTAVEPVLLDAGGTDVVLTPAQGEGGAARWVAIVRPGETYRLRVHQPVFSSVVTFDVSGSLGSWVPRIMAAIRTFTAGVEPGREAIMIMPFEEKPLLKEWSDQPDALREAVDNWIPGGSSAAVTAQLDASALLADRTGMHAIFVIHDAEDESSYLTPVLWQAFARVRPVVFSVLVSQIDTATARGVFQDWADAGDGFYQYATTQGDMDKALARMAAWLRRPADYTLSWSAAHVDHAPSTLRVVPPAGVAVPIGAGAAVELVLDTSGSMLKSLGSSNRIAVAKEVLVRLVNQTLPEGLPVALRTFKAKKKSCDTVLAVPLAPLDRYAMSTVIGGLVINKGTKTPIGAALEAVAGDLGDITGPRVVVLVTDGAETCKGDPAAEVERLREAGFEATVNIVGLALDDEALKAEMASWAAAGGGSFFDAQDAQALLDGITAALQAPFRVYDSEGTLVASGIVGGAAVELPTGFYRVEVLNDPPTTFERVIVPVEGTVELTVGEDP